MSYQQHTLVGNVGNEPELRTVGEEGQVVANFTLAVNEQFGGKEVTTWYRVSCWNKLAEIVNEHLHQGRLIVVEGSRLRASAYINQQGQAAASLELTANRIRFLGAKDGSASRRAEEPPAAPPATKKAANGKQASGGAKASGTRTTRRKAQTDPDDCEQGCSADGAEVAPAHKLDSRMVTRPYIDNTARRCRNGH